MDWSTQQLDALQQATAWIKSPGGDQVFRLFGYAGTGKTTLARTLTQELRGTCLFGAYTGKAASVLRARGCPDALTIHQIIYKPSGKSTKILLELEARLTTLLREFDLQEEADNNPQVLQLRRVIKEETDLVNKPHFVINPDSALHNSELIVIDECSMVDERMGRDLLSFGKKILVLGDPAQLPPVRGEGFFTAGTPNVTLTQIHRQAEGSPIIALATRVRNGETLPVDNQYVFPLSSFTRGLARWADQVIVGRNETRRKFNHNYRQNILNLKTPLPCLGDKLVCLRNNHDVGILNGQLWNVTGTQDPVGSIVELGVRESDDGPPLTVTCHTGHFLGQEIPWWDKKTAEEFDYGYALTCHKSQGSQWPKVLIIDESRCFREHARQWLYTAITRASEEVRILV